MASFSVKITAIGFVVKGKESTLERVPLSLFQEAYNTYSNVYSNTNKTIILDYIDQGGTNTFLKITVYSDNDTVLLTRIVSVSAEGTFLGKSGVVSVPFNINLINNQAPLLKFKVTGCEDIAGAGEAAYYEYSENTLEVVEVIVENYNKYRFKIGREVKGLFKTADNLKYLFKTGKEIKALFKTGDNPKYLFKTGNEIKALFKTVPLVKYLFKTAKEIKALFKTVADVVAGNLTLNATFVIQSNCSNLVITNASVYNNSTTRADYNIQVVYTKENDFVLKNATPNTTNTWNVPTSEGILSVYMFAVPFGITLNLDRNNYKEYLNDESVYSKQFTVISACSILKCIEEANNNQVELILRDDYQEINPFIEYYALYNSMTVAASKNDIPLVKQLYRTLTVKCSINNSTCNC